MINNKELRIGNKLQKDNGEIFTVLRLDNTDDVLVCEERGLLTLDYNLFGIPLTEEWLLKAGAKRFCKDWSLKGVIIHTRKRGFIINKSIPQIKFVHQLQNFIYTNRGKELEFKLK